MNVERAEPGTAEWAETVPPNIADVPVVPAGLTEVYGSPRFTVAVCRGLLATEAHAWAG